MNPFVASISATHAAQAGVLFRDADQEMIYDLASELEELSLLTAGELCEKHLALLGEPSRSRNKAHLVKKLRQNVENALRRGIMSFEESKQLVDSYQAGLVGYTYLESD